MHRRMLIVLCGLLLGETSFADEITIAAAASAQHVVAELKVEFEQDTRIRLKTIIGSSGSLAAQIENGAPFDLFLSADMEYPQALFHKGLAHEAPRVYAHGTLVLWTLGNLDMSHGIEVLSSPSIQYVVIADPKIAPYGREAINALKFYNLYSSISPKLVYGESISQVNGFIVQQAADIGFTAKSAVMAPSMVHEGRWIQVDREAYQPIVQGVVILKHAERHNLAAAQKFYEFLFSEKAKIIYQKYGYIPP